MAEVITIQIEDPGAERPLPAPPAASPAAPAPPVLAPAAPPAASPAAPAPPVLAPAAPPAASPAKHLLPTREDLADLFGIEPPPKAKREAPQAAKAARPGGSMMADVAAGAEKGAAAGPEGAVAGGLKAIAQKATTSAIKSAGKILSKGVSTAGKLTAATVSGSGTRGLAQAAGEAADAAAKVLSKLGPAGEAAAAGLQVATVAVKAFHDVFEALVNRGKELAQYNGDLAGANARQEIAAMQADIREARQIGPLLTRLIDQQTIMEQIFREVALSIKEEVGDFMVVAMKEIIVLLGNLPWIGDKVQQALRRMDGNKKVDIYLDNFLKSLKAADLNRGNRPAARPNDPLNIPIFEG